MLRIIVTLALTAAAVQNGCNPKFVLQNIKDNSPDTRREQTEMSNTEKEDKIIKSAAEWRDELTPEEYRILRQKGTEAPFTGKYDEFFDTGTYLCAACGQDLFTSDAKYNSGCGWPAFYEPAEKDRVQYKKDTTHGMIRTEVLCSRCGGHLGHVFNDGPRPTGQRYCINSVALDFKKDEKED